MKAGSWFRPSLAYNSRNPTVTFDPPDSSPLSASYRGATQFDRASIGEVAYHSSLLGVASAARSGSVTDFFTRDDRGNLLSLRCEGAFYYLFDGQGNVVAVTDKDGAIRSTYEYSPYGETTVETGTLPNPFRYRGETTYVTDAKTGPDQGRPPLLRPRHRPLDAARPARAVRPAGRLEPLRLRRRRPGQQERRNRIDVLRCRRIALLLYLRRRWLGRVRRRHRLVFRIRSRKSERSGGPHGVHRHSRPRIRRTSDV